MKVEVVAEEAIARWIFWLGVGVWERSWLWEVRCERRERVPGSGTQLVKRWWWVRTWEVHCVGVRGRLDQVRIWFMPWYSGLLI